MLLLGAQFAAPDQLKLLLTAFPSLAPEQQQCRTSPQRETLQEILQQPEQWWPLPLPQPTHERQ